MNIDLNKSLFFVNIADLMAHISMIENTSERIEKLDMYVNELNVEMMKLKELECDSPLCILVLTEAIQKLEKEILWYKNMKTSVVTHEFMPLKIGDSKETERPEKSSDVDKKNCMSSVQPKSKIVVFNTTNKNYSSHDSLLIREDIVTYENSNSPININFKKRKAAFVPYQRPSGVIIDENSNITSGQHSSFVPGFSSNSRNMNFSGNIVTSLTYQHSLMDSSKKPRLSWTHDLHREFLRVVEELGGLTVSTPKQIKNRMGIDNLSKDEIKSHLQKCRIQHKQQILASNHALVVSSTSELSLTGQGCQAEKST
ncbi:myb family transcription factor EFM-like [Apium graveolens]|uniref:myb family transcription factor EFM-like n=1 Tax=Apium graveolens TaxID=4045 RepID=UPI003D7A621F